MITTDEFHKMNNSIITLYNMYDNSVYLEHEKTPLEHTSWEASFKTVNFQLIRYIIVYELLELSKMSFEQIKPRYAGLATNVLDIYYKWSVNRAEEASTGKIYPQNNVAYGSRIPRDIHEIIHPSIELNIIETVLFERKVLGIGNKV